MAHLGKNLVIAASLVGAGFMLAWLRFRPWLPEGTELTDGAAIVATDSDALRFAIFDAPEVWAPSDASSRSGIDSAPVFSPDGRYAVFASGLPGEPKDLYVVEFEDGAPGEPEPLARANTPFDEVSPAFSDGFLWFASNRIRPASEGATGERRDLDLYVASFADGQIGEPVALPPSINSKDDERDPAPAADGRSLVFASNSVSGARRDFDLYLARRTTIETGADWAVSRLTALCSEGDDLEPQFGEGERFLVFASDREGGAGAFDLHRSVRDGESFRAPEPIASLASADSERAPRLLDDGFSLLFERVAASDPLASPSLLRARSIELFRVPGRPIGWMEILFVLALLAMALLAWLAKRWETLDVLYKCFLVALAIHLLFLWYSQRVPVEPKEMTLQKREGLFRVQLASALSRAEAGKERGGRLDVARPAARPEASAPARAESLADAGAMPAAAPGSMKLERGERAAAAPSRSAADPERSAAASASRTEVALADRGPELPRNTTAAPSLEVGGPRAIEAPREARSSSGAPSRVELAADAAGAAPVPAPGALALERGERAAETADARAIKAGHAANETIVKRDGAFPEVALAVDAHSAEPARETAAAPELSLSDLTPGAFWDARVAGEASGPSRAELPAIAETIGDPGRESDAPAPAPFELAARDDGAAPARTDVAFTPESAAEAVPSVEVAIAAPTESRRAASMPALPQDHLVLEPVATDFERSDPASVAAAPSRFGVESVPLAPADLAPPRLEFERAEPRHEVAATPPTERFEHTPYKSRFGLEKEVALKTHGGSAETERAVAAGLRYLASRQEPDGNFGDAEIYDDKYGYVVVGKSGLCLLAFLGAGHTPSSNTEYSEVAARAVKFLTDVQTESGHFGWTSAYSHGIATYALAECFALTKDESMRPAIERGVRHILDHQSKSRDPRNGGGWGYFNPDGPHFDKWSRVSITSWQVMALESARLSGIDVPDAAFDRARQFLLSCVDRQYGYIRYCHDPARLSSEYRTLPGSTPAGLFALALLGEDIAGDDYEAERKFVLDRRPKEYRWRGDDAFVHDAAANLYFWYYGSLAMFRVGGEPWTRWNDGMKQALLPSQSKDGSWKPIDNYSERAGDSDSSRCFTTAMNVLTLEVYYRYFTPLLKVK